MEHKKVFGEIAKIDRAGQLEPADLDTRRTNAAAPCGRDYPVAGLGKGLGRPGSRVAAAEYQDGLGCRYRRVLKASFA